jgi:hypothetical protein
VIKGTGRLLAEAVKRQNYEKGNQREKEGILFKVISAILSKEAP